MGSSLIQAADPTCAALVLSRLQQQRARCIDNVGPPGHRV
jgi:hypothetical protein